MTRLQEQRFRALLRYAVQQSPFYRRYYREHGISDRNLDVVRLTDVPPVTKKTIMENFDEVVCDPSIKLKEVQNFILSEGGLGRLYRDKFCVVHTSGTTGTPGIFIYGPREIATVRAILFARVPHRNPGLRRTRLFLLAAVEGYYGGVAISERAPSLLYVKEKCSVNLPLTEIIARAQRYQPDVLGGYASALHMLAESQLKGLLNIKPRQIVTSGEPLTQVARNTIQQAFGVTPNNLYAASESLAMGAECPHGNMHLFNDYHLFETLDESGAVTADADSGSLALTSLYNYTFPLIRYQTSDRLAFKKDYCPCGSGLAVVEGIKGRTEDYLWFDADRERREFIHPITFAELYAPEVEKFRVLQRSHQDFVIQVKAERNHPGIVRTLRSQIDRVLQLKGLNLAVRYTIDFLDEIPIVSKSGKFDLVIPLAKAQKLSLV
jgi:phenylacetate-coenzyme A ligase PaaK-like adenylate-forming protein